MVRIKVIMISGRLSWVLLSYNFLILCPSSDEAKGIIFWINQILQLYLI